MTDYQKLLYFFMGELPEDSPWKGNVKSLVEQLIANGVTFATENNVSGKWIPVTERLPEESGEYLVFCGEYDGICVLYYEILKTKSKWRSKWKEVTHWMPLPDPPKGE